MPNKFNKHIKIVHPVSPVQITPVIVPYVTFTRPINCNFIERNDFNLRLRGKGVVSNNVVELFARIFLHFVGCITSNYRISDVMRIKDGRKVSIGKIM